MSRLMKGSRLSILPGPHGTYIAEITTGMEASRVPELAVTMILEFLEEGFEVEEVIK